MGDGAGSAGKRAGARRGARKRPSFDPLVAVLALGTTACVVAWGYLVYAAIDFGTDARAGESAAWGLMALAALGAVACLFVGLMLIARILRALGITSSPDSETPADDPAAPPPTPGGRRAAR